MSTKPRGVEITCIYCGGVGHAQKFDIKRGRGKYCSHTCAYADKKKIPIGERLLKHIHKTDTCWLWTRAKDPKGYGQIRSECGKTNVQAHRVSYEHHVGKITKGMFVLHKCDVRNCVNPAHLFIGTAQDNTDDMVRKGRDKFNPRQKYFTDEEKKEAHNKANRKYYSSLSEEKKKQRLERSKTYNRNRIDKLKQSSKEGSHGH